MPFRGLNKDRRGFNKNRPGLNKDCRGLNEGRRGLGQRSLSFVVKKKGGWGWVTLQFCRWDQLP